MRRIRTFESLGIRDFRLLWLGQLNAGLGMWMDQMARSYLIYTLTGSAVQLGLAAALRGIPLLLFGLVAGVAADRYSRKATMLLSLASMGALAFLVATLAVTGKIQPWHIYVTAFLAGSAQAFQQPARMSLINDLVGSRHLMNGVALNTAVLQFSRSIGPALAGFIIGWKGVAGSYYFEAGLYFLAFLWTLQIRLPATEGKPSTKPALTPESFFRETGEGLRYVAHNHMMLALMILGLAPVLLAQPYSSLMPMFALDIFKVGASGQGLLLAMVGVGALVGALSIASLGRGARVWLLLAGASLFGLSLVGFANSPTISVALFFTFLAGLFQGSYNSQNQTMVQMLAPDEMRGRIVGVYLLDRGLMPLGTLLAGTLAHYLGAPHTVMIMGLASTAVALGVALLSPALRHYRGPQQERSPV